MTCLLYLLCLPRRCGDAMELTLPSDSCDVAFRCGLGPTGALCWMDPRLGLGSGEPAARCALGAGFGPDRGF